ncbi:hypothetical protein RchiOBHm_Chr2g0084511 [Rosa chinensis]|uniref:Uncharacterized protein n=1 Tax=Rosa chinensis TaxID=74649 RepID=A0A2P6RHV1_ROSCH|nr:uncharacterized protein LOC112186337 [Rosa chinensis]PRQ46010.1 hypothetical protein RchiOBHm_Chr2g0084511 [Rosa chinensis]
MGSFGKVKVCFPSPPLDFEIQISAKSETESEAIMNRSLSSKAAKKPSPAPAKKNKKEQSLRNPLQDLNVISTSNHGSEASSSSMSIEAPRGCLRFFLSHSSSSNLKTPIRTRTSTRPKTLSKTPKSAPLVRPPKDNPSNSKCNVSKHNPQKSKFKTSSSCLYHWQPGNLPSCRNGLKLKACPALNSKGKSFEQRVVNDDDVGQPNELKSGSSDDATFTPLCKIPTGLGLDRKVDNTEDVQQNSDDKSNSTTPPVQASVSPEIQFGSSAVSSASLACYAAGHVLSGVADKRKCRPRGILNVGENDSGFGKGKALCSFEEVVEDDDATGKGMVGDPDASMVPLPTEASMHWILSPCNEEDEDHKEHSESSFQNPAGSPNSGREFSSDVCCHNNYESTTCRSRRNTSISPSGVPKFQEFNNEHVPVLSSPPSTPGCEALPLKDERQYIYEFDAENSPFSLASLSSGNVILTPQSDSSADRHAGLSWSNTDNHRKHYDSELSSVAEAIRMASLSPNRHELIEDQIDSSFQFDCLTTTCNSISRIQKMLDDQAPWHSNSTLENVSQSQLRISWREGLMSRMHDMDEYDCCRCLSDEEEDINGCSNDLPKTSCLSPEITNNVEADQILTDTSWSADILDDEPGVAGKVKEDFPPQSCAESISTDGGGLLASGDSDWNLCYKNELFHV